MNRRPIATEILCGWNDAGFWANIQDLTSQPSSRGRLVWYNFNKEVVTTSRFAPGFQQAVILIAGLLSMITIDPAMRFCSVGIWTQEWTVMMYSGICNSLQVIEIAVGT